MPWSLSIGWNAKEVVQVSTDPKSKGRKAIAAMTLALCAALAVAGVLTATGSARSGSKLGLRAAAGGDLKFNKKKLKAKAGRVRIVMTNPSTSGNKHGIEVSGHGTEKKGKVVGPGRKSRVTIRLKPGRYVFFCPVPGHRAAGMKGTLVVHG